MQAEARRCENALMPMAPQLQVMGSSLQSVCACESQLVAGSIPQNQIAATLAFLRSGQVPSAAYKQAALASAQFCFLQ